MTITEFIRYKLLEDVKTDDFLKAAEKMIPELKTQKGLINWQLCKGENGNWIEILHWKSLDEAKAAAKTVLKLSSIQAFIKFIDEPTTKSTYFETVKNFKT